MAIAGADGIGFVIDMFVVVTFEIGFIEQSPRSSAMCSHTPLWKDHGQVRASFTVGVHK